MKSNFLLLGLTFGISAGTIIGVTTDNIAAVLSIWIGVGLALGAGFGTYVKRRNPRN